MTYAWLSVLRLHVILYCLCDVFYLFWKGLITRLALCLFVAVMLYLFVHKYMLNA